MGYFDGVHVQDVHLADGGFAEYLQYLAPDASHPYDEDLGLGEGGIAAVD
jgi:hypothetical protein